VLQANLPEKTNALTKELTDALHAVLAFSRQDRKRRWDVAICHRRPDPSSATLRVRLS